MVEVKTLHGSSYQLSAISFRLKALAPPKNWLNIRPESLYSFYSDRRAIGQPAQKLIAES
jgi:hypothetical protein